MVVIGSVVGDVGPSDDRYIREPEVHRYLGSSTVTNTTETRVPAYTATAYIAERLGRTHYQSSYRTASYRTAFYRRTPDRVVCFGEASCRKAFIEQFKG